MPPKKVTPQEQVDRADRYKVMMDLEIWKDFESSLKKLYNAWGMEIDGLHKIKSTRENRLDKIDRLLWKRSTITDMMDIPLMAIQMGGEAQKKLDKDKEKKKKGE